MNTVNTVIKIKMVIKKMIKRIKAFGLALFIKDSLRWVLRRSLVLVNLLLPPIIKKLYKTLMMRKSKLPSLPDQFEGLPRAQHGLYKLVNDYKFDTVLDVGAGSGEHSQVLHDSGKA